MHRNDRYIIKATVYALSKGAFLKDAIFFAQLLGGNCTFVSERTWQLQTEFSPPLRISRRCDREEEREAVKSREGKDDDDDDDDDGGFARGMKWQDEVLRGKRQDEGAEFGMKCVQEVGEKSCFHTFPL